MGRLLDGGTALFAFIAAVFWFLSAAGSLPPILTYWGRAPETDPFYQAMKFSALMNMIAAGCSGMSALLFGLRVAFWPFANRHSFLERTEAREGATMTFSERLRTWRDNRRKAGEEWWRNLLKIWPASNLHGIEKPVGVVLFVLKTLTLTELIALLAWNWKGKRKWLPDVYVGIVIVVLGFLLARFPSVVIASYFLASIMVYLLNVVLLDYKVFGDPDHSGWASAVRSPERSLILFILNVAQVVLIFAIFYRWKLPSLEACDALVDAFLVFGTVSLPEKIGEGAKGMAAFQVATDFMLLAVFLAHFVGGLGSQGESNPRPSNDRP